MKKLIAVLFLLNAWVLMANVPFNTTEQPSLFLGTEQTYTFSAGDTTTTFSFINAHICMFTIRDSSMAGTDSIYIALKQVYNGITFYSTVQLLAGSQNTYTTLVSSALVQPTDGLTVNYIWYPGGKIMGSDITWTGVFFVARLNQPPTAAGYAPKTRIIFNYN